MGTNRIDDWGSTAQAGQRFVVVGRKGDWTANWYSGTKVWCCNPHGRDTTPAHDVTVVRAGGTSPVAVYESSHPDADEYPAGLSSHPGPADLLHRPRRPGLRRHSPAAATDDCLPSIGRVVTGGKQMYTIPYSHRTGPVNESDVNAR
ncbi:hypothetical protein [Streptomyces sp. NPDC001970]